MRSPILKAERIVKNHEMKELTLDDEWFFKSLLSEMINDSKFDIQMINGHFKFMKMDDNYFENKINSINEKRFPGPADNIDYFYNQLARHSHLGITTFRIELWDNSYADQSILPNRNL